MSNQTVIVKYNRIEIFGDDAEEYNTNTYSKFKATDNKRILTDKYGTVYTKVDDTYYIKRNSTEHAIRILEMSKYKKSIHRHLIK